MESPGRGPVLLIEDHAVLSEGLALVLRREGYEVHVASPEGADIDELEQTVLAAGARLALLDLHLGPAGHALPLIGPLTQRGTRVVVLTAEEDPVELGACLERGAAGVLAKTIPLYELVEMVRRGLAGDPVMSDTERSDLLDAARAARTAEQERMSLFAALTRREEEVLADLVEGRSARDMAKAAYVSLPTVRSQIRSVFQKLGVNSQLQAVALARESGWRPRGRAGPNP